MWAGFVGLLSALLLSLRNRGMSRSEEAAARTVKGVEAAAVLETVKRRNYLGTGSSRRPQLMKTNGAAGGRALPSRWQSRPQWTRSVSRAGLGAGVAACTPGRLQAEGEQKGRAS